MVFEDWDVCVVGLVVVVVLVCGVLVCGALVVVFVCGAVTSLCMSADCLVVPGDVCGDEEEVGRVVVCPPLPSCDLC